MNIKWPSISVKIIEKSLNFKGSEFSGSDFSGSDFSGSDFSGSEFSGSEVWVFGVWVFVTPEQTARLKSCKRTRLRCDNCFFLFHLRFPFDVRIAKNLFCFLFFCCCAFFNAAMEPLLPGRSGGRTNSLPFLGNHRKFTSVSTPSCRECLVGLNSVQCWTEM